MNIHKYVIPATIAATVHVALIWIGSEGHPPRPPDVIEVPLLPPIPKIPDDPIAMPPEERPASTEPVRPLLGKPAPPSLDETIPTKIPDNAFNMPVDTRPRTIERSLIEVPATIGSEAGVPDGIDPAGLDIFSVISLDGVPRAKVQMPPEYPYAMSRAGISGTVLVEFDVDTTGKVVRAEAVRSTHREFAEPAVRAVRQWRFEPGKRGGKAVSFRMTVPIEFGIEGR